MVNNAQRFMVTQKEYGSFDRYIWSFVNNTPILNHVEHIQNVRTNTELSDQISKELKKKGFQFIGSTIIYSFIQATGMVNDHVMYCSKHTPSNK